MKTLRLALVATLAGIAGSCAIGVAADPKPPAPAPKWVLKIYPKLLPPQPGESIIRDPHAPPPKPVVHRMRDGLDALRDPPEWA